MLKIKRVYEETKSSDGFRILVDRLWPRGLSKEKVKINLWLKEVAPSDELRKWFNHEEEKWEEFRKRYKKELSRNKETEKILEILKKEKTVTLVYSAKDELRNNAVVLQGYLGR